MNMNIDDKGNLATSDTQMKTHREVCNAQHLVDDFFAILLPTQVIFDSPLSHILMFNPIPGTFYFTS